MVDLDTLSIVLTGLALTASILYYAMNLRNANTAKRKDIMFQRINIIDSDFYTNWNENVLQPEWTTYKEWLEYRIEHPDAYGFISFLMMTLNSIGVLLKENIVDEKTIFSAFSPSLVVLSWDRTQPIVYAVREYLNLSNMYDGFEFLYDRTKKLHPEMTGGLEARKSYIENVTKSPT